LHEHRHILQLGGIARQYLSHRDEAGPALVRIKQTFGSKLCCHKLEEEAIRAACPVDLTFENREFHLGDIEVIPTPGHTEGSACFMYKSPHGNTYLFTGDTIFPKNDSWRTYGSNEHQRTLKESLELLGNLKPNVVISSASVGPFSFKQVLPGEWQAIVNGAIRSLS
jgi:glyoxylase-like metal-dependent hydrolase (beta-lactamase superfamily II)